MNKNKLSIKHPNWNNIEAYADQEHIDIDIYTYNEKGAISFRLGECKLLHCDIDSGLQPLKVQRMNEREQNDILYDFRGYEEEENKEPDILAVFVKINPINTNNQLSLL